MFPVQYVPRSSRSRYASKKLNEVERSEPPRARVRRYRRMIWLAIWPGTGELLTEAEVLSRSVDPLVSYWDRLPKLPVHLRCWAGGRLRADACGRCVQMVG